MTAHESRGRGAAGPFAVRARRLGVRTRLLLVVMLATGMAVGVGLLAWTVHDAWQVRARVLAALDAQADSLARAAQADAAAPPQAWLDRLGTDALPTAVYAPDGARLGVHAGTDAQAPTLPERLERPLVPGRTVRAGLAVAVVRAGPDPTAATVMVATRLPGPALPPRGALAGALAVFVGVLLVTALLAGRVLAPVREVARFARAAAQEDADGARLPAGGWGELGVLRRSINALLDAVDTQARGLERARLVLDERVFERTDALTRETAQREQAQREREAALRERETLLENLPDVVLALDAAGVITSFNRRLNAALGLASAQITGRPLHDCVEPEDRERCAGALTRAAREGFASTECRLLHADGTARWYEITARSLHDEHGRPSGLTAVARDITARHAAEARARELAQELEDRVAQRTAQLAAANRELESFSYTVSHDLRAPLRAVEGFARALDEDFAASLPAEGVAYIARVRGAARRMGELIDGLLALSRVTRSEMEVRDVDLSVLSERICAGLAEEEPDRAVQCHIAPGMRAVCDARLVEIALENLLRNAWKYTGRAAAPRVEVGVRVEAGAPVFYVRDNGAGFDPQAAGRLFSVFGRLHRDDEFPGTGIGLATVARIMDRHGGRIWAQASPGEGACFFFTLPERPDTGHTPLAASATGADGG